MTKFLAAVEVDRRRLAHESREAQVDRLTRQLREANARAERAFDQGMHAAVQMMRCGSSADDIEQRIRPEYMLPGIQRTRTRDDARVAIPLEMEDSDEHTEPMIAIPFGR